MFLFIYVFVHMCPKYISPTTRYVFSEQNGMEERGHVRCGFALTEFTEWMNCLPRVSAKTSLVIYVMVSALFFWLDLGDFFLQLRLGGQAQV